MERDTRDVIHLPVGGRVRVGMGRNMLIGIGAFRVCCLRLSYEDVTSCNPVLLRFASVGIALRLSPVYTGGLFFEMKSSGST